MRNNSTVMLVSSPPWRSVSNSTSPDSSVACRLTTPTMLAAPSQALLHQHGRQCGPGFTSLGLNRQHRLTAWRVLHEAIWCGAFSAYIGRCRQQLSLEKASVQAACPRPACQGQPKTLTHLFLTCPSSARVLTWLSAIWTQLKGSPGPPLSAALLMADDQRRWQPQPAHLQPLWTQLRIAALAAIHTARAQRRQSMPTITTSVAARLVHQMRAAMLRD